MCGLGPVSATGFFFTKRYGIGESGITLQSWRPLTRGMKLAFGAHSGKQLSPLTENMGSRLKWWHKIDDPTIQILTAEGSVFAELSWPERVRHQGSPAVGQSADSEYNFRKESTARGAVSILIDGADVGKVIAVIGRPSTIALSNGQNYTLAMKDLLERTGFS